MTTNSSDAFDDRWEPFIESFKVGKLTATVGTYWEV